MLTSLVNSFTGVITNMTGRPASTYGTSITPGNNTFPAYVEILSNTAYECFGIEININSVGSAAKKAPLLVTLGFDHSGGTTYTDNTISNLIGANASAYNAGGGVNYYFPLYIPEGTAIAATASIDNITVGTARVGVRLYGRPTRPELVRCGSYVDSFGATTATSRGTSITPGTASEGSWTEMTSGTTTKPYWHFQAGFGCDDTTMTNGLVQHIDLSVGDASNKYIVFEDMCYNVTTANEEATTRLMPLHKYVYDVKDGQRIYLRAQCSTTSDTTNYAMAYALGG